MLMEMEGFERFFNRQMAMEEHKLILAIIECVVRHFQGRIRPFFPMFDGILMCHDGSIPQYTACR